MQNASTNDDDMLGESQITPTEQAAAVAPGTPTPAPASSPLERRNPQRLTYISQGGDTLAVVAARFGVYPEEVEFQGLAPGIVPGSSGGFLNPGLVLTIPDRLVEGTTAPDRLLPDSEFLFTPSASDFDPEAYAEDAGGYFASYVETIWSGIPLSGPELIADVALDNSINPRLLLALLEYRCGCVRGELADDIDPLYMAGVGGLKDLGLYNQLVWLIGQLNEGYYGWRAGTLTHLVFQDGSTLRLDPALNAGTVALHYLFAQLFDREGYQGAIADFPALFEEMFGNPWARAAQVEPLFPPDLRQPEMVLPFLPGHTWSYTGGPHSAWEMHGPEAAVDFNPGGMVNDCEPDRGWVVAMADGLVVRLESGLLVQDLDGDGDEHTGWVIMYVHLMSSPSIEVGSWLETDRIIGRPSCLGGPTDSAHIHIARKYNGEWMLAGGALPLTMSGWVVGDSPEYYKGTLTRGGEVIISCTCGMPYTYIERDRDE